MNCTVLTHLKVQAARLLSGEWYSNYVLRANYVFSKRFLSAAPFICETLYILLIFDRTLGYMGNKPSPLDINKTITRANDGTSPQVENGYPDDLT